MEKYSGVASVISIDPAALRARLLAEEICIIFLLMEVEEDKLMAYQHSKRSNFLTHKGVDKLHGTERIAAALDFDPAHSVGAGDTQMDTFLQGMGLALHVGPMELEFCHHHASFRREAKTSGATRRRLNQHDRRDYRLGMLCLEHRAMVGSVDSAARPFYRCEANIS